LKQNKIIIYIFSFTLIITTLLTVVDYACFDRSFYKKEYKKSNTKEVIKTTDEDLEKMTDVLLGYLKGDYGSLDLKASINGETREVFNEREKEHMVDVKNLYQGALTTRNVLAIISIISFIVIIFKKSYFDIHKIYLKTLLFVGLIILFLSIYVFIDFDTFWTNFHHIFFSGNDLWLLDPSSDVLIMMVPGTFFNDLVWKIIIIFVITIAIFYLVFKLPQVIIERKSLSNVKD